MTMDVISITAPKSGSHMVGFAMGIGTRPTWHLTASGKPGQYRTEDQIIAMLNDWPSGAGIWTHVPHSKKMVDYFRERFKVQVFTRRDPRDIIVSLGHYIDKFPSTSLNLVYNGVKLSDMVWKDRMFYIIEEYGFQLLQFSPWIREHGVLQIKYEDCIDDREMVFGKLRTDLIARGQSPPELSSMVHGSQKRHQISYRRAKYGDWKSDFDSDHVEHAKVHLADTMEAYGYEW